MTMIRALPGSGKTTLAKKRPDLFVDSDVIVDELFGVPVTKHLFEMLDADPAKSALLREAFYSAVADGKVVLTNFYPERYGMQTTLHVTYKEDDYLAHLRASGRAEMLEMFSEDELRSWTQFDSGGARKIELAAGEFVEDALLLAMPQLFTPT